MTMRPQEHRWGIGERPSLEGGACAGRRERTEGARKQEIQILPEKGRELAWFGWNIGRGVAGLASKTSWAKLRGLELILKVH